MFLINFPFAVSISKGREMKTKIKSLGCTLVALLAIAGIQASTASAEPLFHSEAEHTIGTGEQETQIVFTVNAGTIKCNKLSGQGTMAGKTFTEATTTPVYSECTAFGFLNATINMNGCHFVITADIEVHMICPAGQMMVVKAGNCTVKVGPQSATSVEYETVGTGSKREIIAREEGSGIHYLQEDGFLCPGTGSGTFTDGKAVGSVRTKGENTEGKQVGIWWTDE
jgi:hypothetical protein